jgi:hypothetical protein
VGASVGVGAELGDGEAVAEASATSDGLGLAAAGVPASVMVIATPPPITTTIANAAATAIRRLGFGNRACSPEAGTSSLVIVADPSTGPDRAILQGRPVPCQIGPTNLGPFL